MRLGYVFVSQNRYKILKSCLKLNLTWFWCEQVPTRPENNGLKCVICSTETKPASSHFVKKYEIRKLNRAFDFCELDLICLGLRRPQSTRQTKPAREKEIFYRQPFCMPCGASDRMSSQLALSRIIFQGRCQKHPQITLLSMCHVTNFKKQSLGLL